MEKEETFLGIKNPAEFLDNRIRGLSREDWEKGLWGTKIKGLSNKRRK
jgi:hypothetical protein